MSAEPLSREEREQMVNAAQIMALMTENNPYHDLGLAIETYEATVQAVEAERDALARRVERAEKVVGLFRALDDDAGPGEASYAQAWDMVADLIAALAADDAARGEA